MERHRRCAGTENVASGLLAGARKLRRRPPFHRSLYSVLCPYMGFNEVETTIILSGLYIYVEPVLKIIVFCHDALMQ